MLVRFASFVVFCAAAAAVCAEVVTAAERPLNFENDIVPILSRYGCNSSGCHGKAEGQNGFKLSVFGFDPAADYRALAVEGRGRRVFPAAPEKSLLLLKASGGMPHGGGVRIDPARPEYATLRRWIAAGMPLGSPTIQRLRRLSFQRTRQRWRWVRRCRSSSRRPGPTAARRMSRPRTFPVEQRRPGRGR